jgi:hypothetical protein
MEFARIGVEVVDESTSARLTNLVDGLGLLASIKLARLEDPKCAKIKQLLRHKDFALKMLGCSPRSVCRKVKD